MRRSCCRLRRSGKSPSSLAGTGVVFQAGGECGGDLTLRDRRHLLPFTARGRVGTQETDPDVLRARDLLAVVFPFDGCISPPVVGGENKGGLIPILRHG